MPEADFEQMNQIRSQMEALYSSTTICEYNNPNNCGVTLAEISSKIATLTDYDKLAYYWTEWHNAVGQSIPASLYQQFADKQNQLAQANGLPDASQLLLATFDDETPSWNSTHFEELAQDLWAQVEPAYKKLLAYIRMKLRRMPEYADKIEKYGYVPANLLKNMLSLDWSGLDELTKPFPGALDIDVTRDMIAKGYTVEQIFRESDTFFQSLGYEPMTPTFWNKSMMTRPDDGRQVVCGGQMEWDLCLGKGSTDFRIKMCGDVSQTYIETIHHEMGHMQYFMQYTDKDYIFRDGGNPGFHETVGNGFGLPVVSPKHLKYVLGLELGTIVNCEEGGRSPVSESDINALYLRALGQFPFLPFALSTDRWRWEVFSGRVSQEEYNRRWWELRSKFQLVVPPSSRNSTEHFDPAASRPIVGHIPYIRYYMSYIMMYEFHQIACQTAGEFQPGNPNGQPLYQCDYTGSTEAGRLLGELLKTGFSTPWPATWQNLTGGEEALPSAQPMLAYFKPLFDVIDAELVLNGESPCFGGESDYPCKI